MEKTNSEMAPSTYVPDVRDNPCLEGDHDADIPYLPSPEMIRRECWKLKSGWSRETQIERMGGNYVPAQCVKNFDRGFLNPKLTGPDVGRQRRKAKIAESQR